ncbi:adenylate kinase [Pseudobythopirellula maris]|uniref:Adenylate kinase n=1 Tax=Pseudobythopirellula maris TaxID=2527991 RepID=A0A5C5ZNU9_9BACT|nr:adenylate kinase [Pseudobythopirellula maris]TWT88103.1 adenylate kinase [Pseudobythopirellula maris]
MRIVFIGPPGAGKGTQSLRVAKDLGVTHLSTGEVLRESRERGAVIGKRAAVYLDAGKLVPDEIVIELVAYRLAESDCKSGYLFDGFPRTLAQAKSLDALLAQQDAPLHAAIEFVIPEEELLERLSKRGREDDTKERIRERLRQHSEITVPMTEYYEELGILYRIDAVGTPDEVFARIGEALAGIDQS